MTDDSTSTPPVQDSTPSVQVSPPDQTTQSINIGQQPEGTWPNSTNLANSPLSADSNLAYDQVTTPVSPPPVEEKPPEPSVIPEPPKEETAPPPPLSEISQVAEPPPDTTWPDSTQMANLSAEADSSAKVDENSADTSTSTNPSSPPTDQPVVSADSSLPSIPPVTPTEPVSSVPPESPPPARNAQPRDAGGLPTSPLPSEAPAKEGSSPPENPTIAEEKPPESPPQQPDLSAGAVPNISLPDNQAPQVQQEAPKETSGVDAEKPPEDLANFKTEPLESPQTPQATLGDSQVSDKTTPGVVLDDSPGVKEPVTPSPSVSFGDLLSSENQPPPAPSASFIPSIPSTPTAPSVPSVPSSPSVSFGDLIKDLKPEESVIPPPPPVPPSPLPISFTPQPISPSSPISPISTQTDQLSLRRQKANQVRSQKKTNHLSKIMELAKNTKSISNTDVQRLLRVSQSTATNYLAELAGKGLLKRQGIRGGVKYTL